MTFQINSIVKGKVAGTFVVLGERLIAGERVVQLKPVHPETHAPLRGELALPADVLRAA